MKTTTLLATTLFALCPLAWAETPKLECTPPLETQPDGHCACPGGNPPAFTSYGTPLCSYINEAPRACVVTLIYNPAAPGGQNLLRDPNPACDAASLELALAIAVARLLGAP